MIALRHLDKLSQTLSTSLPTELVQVHLSWDEYATGFLHAEAYHGSTHAGGYSGGFWSFGKWLRGFPVNCTTQPPTALRYLLIKQERIR